MCARGFLDGSSSLVALFPLTPALSLGERAWEGANHLLRRVNTRLGPSRQGSNS